MTPEEKRERQREYERRWREKNPGKTREYARAYRERHPARARESSKRWQEANPERVREKDRAYRLANADRIREQQQVYNQQHKQSLGTRKPRDKEVQRAASLRYMHGMTPADWSALWNAQAGRCYLCGDPMDLSAPKRIAIDHDHDCCPKNRSCPACRRGLAHLTCNLLVGYGSDDPDLLRRIADNLEHAVATTRERLAAKPVQGELAG